MAEAWDELRRLGPAQPARRERLQRLLLTGLPVRQASDLSCRIGALRARLEALAEPEVLHALDLLQADTEKWLGGHTPTAARRRDVVACLMDSEKKDWSDRAIARHIGVSPQTVGNWRRRLTGPDESSGQPTPAASAGRAAPSGLSPTQPDAAVSGAVSGAVPIPSATAPSGPARTRAAAAMVDSVRTQAAERPDNSDNHDNHDNSDDDVAAAGPASAATTARKDAARDFTLPPPRPVSDTFLSRPAATHGCRTDTLPDGYVTLAMAARLFEPTPDPERLAHVLRNACTAAGIRQARWRDETGTIHAVFPMSIVGTLPGRRRTG